MVINNLSNHVSSIRSISLEKASSRTYSLVGMQAENPEKGINAAEFAGVQFVQSFYISSGQ